MSKIFPFTGGEGGGGSLTKIFFPVWTCIKPNLVSKSFPFTETRYPPLDLRLGTPPPGPGTPSSTWTWTPLPGPGPGTPPTWTWTWDPPYPDLDLGPPPPCRGVDWHTKWKYNLPHPSDAGGKYTGPNINQWISCILPLISTKITFHRLILLVMKSTPPCAVWCVDLLSCYHVDCLASLICIRRLTFHERN